MAYNIDLLFYLLFAFMLRISINKPMTMYLALSLVIFLFEVAFLSSSWSATPGRKLLNIEVIATNKQKLGITMILIRTLIKPLSLLLAFGGFVLIFLRDDKRSLHDLIAGSIVVKSEHD